MSDLDFQFEAGDIDEVASAEILQFTKKCGFDFNEHPYLPDTERVVVKPHALLREMVKMVEHAHKWISENEADAPENTQLLHAYISGTLASGLAKHECQSHIMSYRSWYQEFFRLMSIRN